MIDRPSFSRDHSAGVGVNARQTVLLSTESSANSQRPSTEAIPHTANCPTSDERCAAGPQAMPTMAAVVIPGEAATRERSTAGLSQLPRPTLVAVAARMGRIQALEARCANRVARATPVIPSGRTRLKESRTFRMPSSSVTSATRRIWPVLASAFALVAVTERRTRKLISAVSATGPAKKSAPTQRRITVPPKTTPRPPPTNAKATAITAVRRKTVVSFSRSPVPATPPKRGNNPDSGSSAA